MQRRSAHCSLDASVRAGRALVRIARGLLYFQSLLAKPALKEMRERLHQHGTRFRLSHIPERVELVLSTLRVAPTKPR